MSTLDELLAKSAQDWTEPEILQLIEGFRSQRERWSAEQKEGSKKRILAAKIEVKPTKKDLAFAGLKL